MMKILLAEDDVDDQELLAEAFTEIDPTIDLQSFSTGKKFLTHLDSLPDSEIPDMIILDYNIPEINGAEILKRLELPYIPSVGNFVTVQVGDGAEVFRRLLRRGVIVRPIAVGSTGR